MKSLFTGHKAKMEKLVGISGCYSIVITVAQSVIILLWKSRQLLSYRKQMQHMMDYAKFENTAQAVREWKNKLDKVQQP